MPLRDTYLRDANIILQKLKEENIQTPEQRDDPIFRALLTTLLTISREKALELAQSYPAPGLTSCVAVTLLKVGACQELAQRFSLEYILYLNQANVHLIFLANPAIGCADNHVFVLVGTPIGSDELIIGRTTGPVYLPDDKKYLPINLFLKQQLSESVIVDPLLNVAAPVHGHVSSVMDYCKRHNITHVVGIKSYQTMLGIIDGAAEVKKNAQIIASQIKTQLNPSTTRFFSSHTPAVLPQDLPATQNASAIEQLSTTTKPQTTKTSVGAFGFKPGFLNQPKKNNAEKPKENEPKPKPK